MSTMFRCLTGAVPAIAGAAFAFSWPTPARAQTPPNCADLPKPVYVAGSTAVQPFLAKVAGALAAATPPITVVYQGQGSCVGVGYLTSSSNTITGTGVIWDTSGTAISGGCMLSLTGDTVVIGISDVYATTCPGVTGLPTDVQDFKGPVQSMTFVAPTASGQTAISAEAAYLVLGFGGTSNPVSPWTDATAIEVRSPTSGTQQMISAAINVQAAKWQGVANSGSGAVVTALQNLATAGNQEKAIGILASDVADKNRATLKVIAYQHYGQHCGYLPDSTPTAFDKQNVRDGHYYIWGPLHLLTKISSPTVAVDPNAQAVITALANPSVDLITTEAKAGVVPDCAMRVTRTGEVGPLASYMPAKSCECAFLTAATGTAPSTCKVCSTNAECTDASKPACNYGYCEVQ